MIDFFIFKKKADTFCDLSLIFMDFIFYTKYNIRNSGG